MNPFNRIVFGKPIGKHIEEFADEIVNFLYIPVTIITGDKNKYDPKTGNVMPPEPKTKSDIRFENVIVLVAVIVVGYMVYQEALPLLAHTFSRIHDL
ncbi:MAG: hypothetical protein WA056_02180 [Gallionella sp.]